MCKVGDTVPALDGPVHAPIMCKVGDTVEGPEGKALAPVMCKVGDTVESPEGKTLAPAMCKIGDTVPPLEGPVHSPVMCKIGDLVHGPEGKALAPAMCKVGDTVPPVDGPVHAPVMCKIGDTVPTPDAPVHAPTQMLRIGDTVPPPDVSAHAPISYIMQDTNASPSIRDTNNIAPLQTSPNDLPPLGLLDSDVDRPGAEDRYRMRQFWEKEGWLPGPPPRKYIKARRRKALRHLGLTEEGDALKQVLAKYADMAGKMFNTKGSFVRIIYDDAEITYGPDPNEPPTAAAIGSTLSAHVLLCPKEEVHVIADVSKDWRHAKNPFVVKQQCRFYAAVPLRYHLRNQFVDIGTLAIHDPEPRDHFDQRESDMLLNLANMLMYQLITLQSEMSAKRLSSMYQESINYLRRSVVPEYAKPKRKEKSHKSSGIIAPRGFELPRNPCGEPMSHTAIKTGPKDSQAAKRKMQQSDKELYADAANTLKNLLEADHVAVLSAADFQLFIRCAGSDPLPKKRETKEQLVGDWLNGKPWPAHVDPIIMHVPRSSDRGLQLLGQSGSAQLHLDQPGVEGTFADVIKASLKSRRFWFYRDDEEDDELSHRVMALVPDQAQITLAVCWPTYNGALKFLSFVSWNKPPSMLGHTAKAVPFAWLLSSLTSGVLAVRSIRNMEESQISYSNLQAHELRTPMHQILAITQLLRASMNDLAETPAATGKPVCIQQIRDLLPYLDAIDTSGKTLHGIVDNILSFLDLKAKDAVRGDSPTLLNSPSGPIKSLQVMMEEVIHDAADEDRRARRANGQPASNVETIFEIIPLGLGDELTEDTGGALRRALSKLLTNAYKFIEGAGCVEIYVDYVNNCETPEGYEELSATKNIGIKIVDTGRGMDEEFVRQKLGEPWAKEDSFATGSGLSVHLAWRIIDLLGGHMEISSSPGKGTMVQIEVPVPRFNSSISSTPSNSPHPTQQTFKLEHPFTGRKVALVGFDTPDSCPWGLPRVGASLFRQYTKLGCIITDLSSADLVIVDGRKEELPGFADTLSEIHTTDVVILVGTDHEPHPSAVTAARSLHKHIRRLHKPATPSIIRETLLPTPSRLAVEHRTNPSSDSDIISPSPITQRLRAHFATSASDSSTSPKCSFVHDLVQGLGLNWKPKGITIEEAVANLSLGDYFSSRRRPTTPSTSTPSTTGTEDTTETNGTTETADTEHSHLGEETDLTSPETLVEPEVIKVLVVEDNRINRKILVKILSTKLAIEVVEAEDGLAALELFKTFTSPSIILMDINMPKMDGYTAALEMRLLEKSSPSRGRSKIIAVTALASDAEKKHGLVESGMDLWLTKPCDKATITRVVDEARKELLGVE
ncbi:hypothetical protein M231_05937 [Tremella mesenterica]|uniref:histidine kinase n=1 Tax=Tremella mesenterica TaxID=5217 RepID=A0A4Q1BGR7_TREME|nr:hypothetical protein M231_05937 [Tremella mesenterica]